MSQATLPHGLSSALQDALAGRGLKVHCLTGSPGGPAGRLLGALVAEAGVAAMPPARGQGAEAAPYEALRPWLAALAAGLGPEDRQRLGPAIARLAPEVGVPAAVPLEGAKERARAHGALAEIALARFPGPLLWPLADADRLDPASRALVADLRRLTAGRPWAWLETAPAAAPGVAAWPVPSSGVPPAAALLARLAGLPTAARDVAAAASVLGTSGGLVELAEVAGLGDLQPFAVGLSALEEAELFVREDERWRFPRADLAPAIAEALPPAEARGLASRAFARLTYAAYGPAGGTPGVTARGAVGDADASPVPPGMPFSRVWQAAHLGLMAGLGHEAVPWVEAAARGALARGAGEPAAKLTERALRIPALPGPERRALLGERVEALRQMGEGGSALALLTETLLPEARRARDPGLPGWLATWGVLLQARMRYEEALDAFAKAIEAAERARLPLVGLRARLYAARVALFTGKAGMAGTLMRAGERRARALVEAGGEDGERARPWLAWALDMRGFVAAAGEPAGAETAGFEAGVAWLEEAVAIDRAIGDRVALRDALHHLGSVLVAHGQPAAALGALAEHVKLCEEVDSPVEAVFACAAFASAMLAAGDAAGAMALATATRPIAASYGLASVELELARIMEPPAG